MDTARQKPENTNGHRRGVHWLRSLVVCLLLSDFAVLAIVPNHEITALDYFGTRFAVGETLCAVGQTNHGELVKFGHGILAAATRCLVPGEWPASIGSVGTGRVDLGFCAGGTALAPEGGCGVADVGGGHGVYRFELADGVEVSFWKTILGGKLGLVFENLDGLGGSRLQGNFDVADLDQLLATSKNRAGLKRTVFLGQLTIRADHPLTLVVGEAGGDRAGGGGGDGCHGLGWLIGALAPADAKNLPKRLGFARKISNYFHGPISGLPHNADVLAPAGEKTPTKKTDERYRKPQRRC